VFSDVITYTAVVYLLRIWRIVCSTTK